MEHKIINSGFVFWWYWGLNPGTWTCYKQVFYHRVISSRMAILDLNCASPYYIGLFFHFAFSISCLQIHLPFLFPFKSAQRTQFHPLNPLLSWGVAISSVDSQIPCCSPCSSVALWPLGTKRGRSYLVALQSKQGRGSSLVKLWYARHTDMSPEWWQWQLCAVQH